MAAYSVWRANMRHHAKCCPNRCRDFAIFGFLEMADSAIFDFVKFKFLQSQLSRRSNCLIVPKLVVIARTAAEIWRFFDISKWRPSPFWIF